MNNRGQNRSLWRWLVLALVLALPAWASAAYNYRALLVGVSEYPSLEKSLQLAGPRNDVVRVRNLLLQRGFDTRNLVVLADGVEGAALPTRANILAQLDVLARTAKPNDYIVIHMAGHGSQQPVPAGSPYTADEPDGLFEIFLPRDVANWANLPAGQGGAVQNAIVDYEIRQAIDRMTAAGAFVWAIFDSCHSATLVRSASESGTEVRLRQVLPSALGIPANEMERAAKQARASAAGPPARRVDARSGGAGSAVYFYAAQSTQPTPELPLPAGNPERVPRGLFTYELMVGLEGGGAMTYRQLAQFVLAQYGGIGEARATPLFSGTALDKPVLGQVTSDVKQWRLLPDPPLRMAVGALAEVQEGAVLAILPTATAATDAALGYAVVSEVGANSSVLRPVAYAERPARSPEDLATGAVARMIRPSVRMNFSVGVDLSQCGMPCPYQAAIDQLRAVPPSGANTPALQLQWVGDGRAADIRLRALHGRLWLLPATLAGQQLCANLTAGALSACQEQLDRSLVSVTAGPGATATGLADTLRAALHAASRAANLMRIAGALANTNASRQLQTTIEVVGKDGRRRPYAAGQVPRLTDGDRVAVALHNTGQEAIDVTALYLDSRFGVSVMFPGYMGDSNRLEAGATERFELDVKDSTLGLERLAVIAVQAQKHAERADFSFLAQPTLNSELVSRGADLGAQSDTFAAFRDAGFAEYATRGGKPSTPTERTGMQLFSWQVVR